MAERACSIDGCVKRVHCKGLCPMHYQRKRIHGDVGPAEPVHRYGELAEVCVVDGCIKKASSRDMCPMHYQRWRQRGDVGTAEPERHQHRGAPCSVEGCDQPGRKMTWCAGHYSQWAREGAVRPFRFKWAEHGQPCVVCAESTEGSEVGRKFCSWRCSALWYAHEGDVPTSVTCALCEVTIDLTERLPSGYRRRSDTRLCRQCRAAIHKHGFSAGQLARLYGDRCGICGAPVDMRLRRPDVMSPSVDHIVPRALGGTNELGNVQLAHLRCNSVKAHRMEVTLG